VGELFVVVQTGIRIQESGVQELQERGALYVLWAIIEAKNPGRAKLRMSRKRRVIPARTEPRPTERQTDSYPLPKYFIAAETPPG
jgi:hypothetical protein